jgi:hypothetical protein
MPMSAKARTTTKPDTWARIMWRRLPTHQPTTHPGTMLHDEYRPPFVNPQSALTIELNSCFRAALRSSMQSGARRPTRRSVCRKSPA